MKSWDELILELREKESLAKMGGGTKKQHLQKSKGKMLCRERIAAIVDPKKTYDMKTKEPSLRCVATNQGLILCLHGQLLNLR